MQCNNRSSSGQAHEAVALLVLYLSCFKSTKLKRSFYSWINIYSRYYNVLCRIMFCLLQAWRRPEPSLHCCRGQGSRDQRSLGGQRGRGGLNNYNNNCRDATAATADQTGPLLPGHSLWWDGVRLWCQNCVLYVLINSRELFLLTASFHSKELYTGIWNINYLLDSGYEVWINSRFLDKLSRWMHVIRFIFCFWSFVAKRICLLPPYFLVFAICVTQSCM